MKPLLATLSLFLLLVFPLSAHDWGDQMREISKSLARVETPTSICTAFSIHQSRGYLMTAIHCLGPLLMVNSKLAQPIALFEQLDVAVIEANVHLPALSMRSSMTRAGDMVGGAGFGYGLKEPIFRGGYVSHPQAQWGDSVVRWFVFDAPFVEGMSGGPVFDRQGRVITLIQRTDPKSGLGLSTLQFTREFWEKP